MSTTDTQMTRERLRQYGSLKREIVLLEQQLARLPDEVHDSSICEQIRIRLAIRKTKITAERDAIENYIDNINDSLIRMAISLRYVNGLSWRQVAYSIGGGNTADSLKQACKRFLVKAGK